MKRTRLSLLVGSFFLATSMQMGVADMADGLNAYYSGDTTAAYEALLPYGDTDAKSAFLLGMLEMDVSPSAEGVEKMRKWLLIAEEKGMIEATYNLALIDYFNQVDEPEKVLERLEKAADEGLSQAGILLAVLYLDISQSGNNLYPKDAKKGIAHLEKLNAENNPMAALLLGLVHFGDQEDMPPLGDFKQDSTKGIAYLESALSDEFIMPAMVLAEIYAEGRHDIKADAEKAQYYKAFVEENFMQFFLMEDPASPSLIKIDALLSAEEIANTLQTLEEKAANNDLEAIILLGNIYRAGVIVPENRTLALEYYKKAADLGDMTALFYVADSLEGDEQIIYLEKAAEGGSVRALRSLAEIHNAYYSDYYDEKRAFHYLLKAADLSDVDAQFLVANTYLKERHDKNSQAQAVKWYERIIAEQSESDAHQRQAHLNLGDLYADEEGVLYNIELAKAAYEKALEVGDPVGYAEYRLAKIEEMNDPKKAVARYESILDKANPESEEVRGFTALRLGKIYRQGAEGIEKDRQKAHDYFVTALAYDVTAANYYLGEDYYDGIVVEKDLAKAKAYFREASSEYYDADYHYHKVIVEMGDPKEIEAIREKLLDNAHYRGNGQPEYLTLAFSVLGDTPEDLAWLYNYYYWKEQSKALEKLKELAKTSDLAEHYYGYALIKKGAPFDEAIAILEKTAEKGVVESMTLLGSIYRQNEWTIGRSIEFNPERALHWYEKAAELGGDKEKEKLAEIYFKEEYRFRDYRKAKAAYESISPEWKYYDSVQKNLATINEALKEVDAVEARYKAGDLDAALELAEWHLSGKKGFTSDEKGLELIKEAADKGHRDAQFRYAHYRNHDDTRLSKAERFRYYLLAAENGHEEAAGEVAERYYKGNGVEYNREEARKWFSVASRYSINSPAAPYYLSHINKFDQALEKADAGELESIYQVAMWYSSGYGVKSDPLKSIEYYQKAIEKGHTDALYRLGQIYINGDLGTFDWELALPLFQKAAKAGNSYATEMLEHYEKDVKAALEGDLEGRVHYAEYLINEIRSYSEAYQKPEFAYALGFLESAQQEGSGRASYLLAELYGGDYADRFFEKEDNAKERYVELLKEAVERGDASAKVALGNYYMSDESLSASERETLLETLYLEALEEDKEAFESLMKLYGGKIEGVPANFEKAKALLFKECGAENKDACYYLADAYKNGTYGMAKNWRKAAGVFTGIEDDDAVYAYLAGLYLQGDETLPQNFELAATYYEKGLHLLEAKEAAMTSENTLWFGVDSAELFAYRAARNFSEYRDHSPEAKVLTAAWWKKAFEYNYYEDGAHVLMEHYRDANDFETAYYYALLNNEKDPYFRSRIDEAKQAEIEAAAKKFRNAAPFLKYKAYMNARIESAEKSGEGRDYYYLARVYLEKRFTPFDFDQAVAYFEKSGELGYSSAYNYLGGLYRDGDYDQAKDMGKAVYYFDLGAKQGDSNCAHLAGDAYYFGQNGLTINYSKAAYYFDLTKIDDGTHHALAKFKLGNIYYKGLGVPRDLNKAYELLQLAAKYHDGFAIEALNEWDFSEIGK